MLIRFCELNKGIFPEYYQIDIYPDSCVIEEVINYLKNNINLDNSNEDLTKHELKNIEWWWNRLNK